MRRANYSVVSEGDKRIILHDNGPWSIYPTITNDAEGVVAEQHAIGMGDRKLFYYDSDNELTELVHDGNGKFLCFKYAHPEML